MPATPSRLRSAQAAVGISGFFAAVEDALALQLQIQKWPVGTSPTFVHEFPQERLGRPDDPFDVITVGCGGSHMAPTDNDGKRVPIRPLLVEEKPDPGKLGYNLVTLQWKEITAVVFKIWSKSNARADAMTEWFHLFLMTFAHVNRFFEARGVERFTFEERGRDEESTLQGQEIYTRTLVYSVRLQYLIQAQRKTLDQVTVNLGISNGSGIGTFNLDTQSR